MVDIRTKVESVLWIQMLLVVRPLATTLVVIAAPFVEVHISKRLGVLVAKTATVVSVL